MKLLVIGRGRARARRAAAAEHRHWIDTPAGCKEDIASGQTRKEESHPGGHKFHDNVHAGTPGEKAFARPGNPVSVGRDECPE